MYRSAQIVCSDSRCYGATADAAVLLVVAGLGQAR